MVRERSGPCTQKPRSASQSCCQGQAWLSCLCPSRCNRHYFFVELSPGHSIEPDHTGDRRRKRGRVQDERLHTSIRQVDSKTFHRLCLSQQPRQNRPRRPAPPPSSTHRSTTQLNSHRTP